MESKAFELVIAFSTTIIILNMLELVCAQHTHTAFELAFVFFTIIIIDAGRGGLKSSRVGLLT